MVLDPLQPAERIAFVLHGMFAVPFDEIAPIVERTPVATKKLASRARRKVQGTPVGAAAELSRHRQVVSAFLAAARAGDLTAILAVLAPGVVRRADPAALPPGAAAELHGARAVAEGTVALARRSQFADWCWSTAQWDSSWLRVASYCWQSPSPSRMTRSSGTK